MYSCSFDSSRLLNSLQKWKLLEEFKNFAERFIDTLIVIKKNYRGLPSGRYKLTSLVERFVSLSSDAGHDAL